MNGEGQILFRGDYYPEPWPEQRREHVNLDYGRRWRLLPREKQPDCGCGECLQRRAQTRQPEVGY